jgi:hypothetical protein
LQFARSAAVLQNQFNEVAESLLAVDNDDCIADSDPNLSDPTTAIEDDTRVFAEFFITPTSPETFPPPFNDAKYLNIINTKDRDDLLNATFSQIKLVKSLPFPTLAVAAKDGSGNMIFSDDAVGSALLHEWMHTNYVDHRGTMWNTGTTTGSDQKAIMYSVFYPNGQNEVNRYESAYLDF